MFFAHFKNYTCVLYLVVFLLLLINISCDSNNDSTKNQVDSNWDLVIDGVTYNIAEKNVLVVRDKDNKITGTFPFGKRSFHFVRQLARSFILTPFSFAPPGHPGFAFVVLLKYARWISEMQARGQKK